MRLGWTLDMDIENTIGLFELETRKSIVLAGKITPIRVQNIEVNIVLCVLLYWLARLHLSEYRI